MSTADPVLSTLLKRDRIVVIAALFLLAVMAWAYVLWLSAQMAMPADIAVSHTPGPGAMSGDMPGMNMGEAPAAAEGTVDSQAAATGGTTIGPAYRIWGPADFAFTFAMWSVMMVGMMTPSVAPMVLLYAGVARKAVEGGSPFASTGWFVGGYLATWVTFSAVATGAQWALTRAALLTPTLAVTSSAVGAVVLIATGLYQWSSLKSTCLRACQSPIGFLMAHGGFRPEWTRAFSLGVAHGAYCLGCCIVLMALLFVGGIMNVLWIAGLTILILLEKVVPSGRLVSGISGTLMAAAGVWILVRGA
jgi:predicted metal-binding membrane protein